MKHRLTTSYSQHGQEELFAHSLMPVLWGICSIYNSIDEPALVCMAINAGELRIAPRLEKHLQHMAKCVVSPRQTPMSFPLLSAAENSAF